MLDVEAVRAALPVDLAGGGKWGMYRTTNSGASWVAANTGLRALKIDGLHVSGGYLYAAGDGLGFFRSADHGTTWGCTTPSCWRPSPWCCSPWRGAAPEKGA